MPPTDNYTIRTANPTDLAQLVGLLKILFAIEEDFIFNESLQRRGLEMMLNNPAAQILVAEIQGQVVGMCSGQYTISTAEGGPALLLEDLVVQEEFRGAGIGQQLAKSLELWAQGNGVSRLQLLADRHNSSALNFYQKLGWQHTQLICLRKRL